MPPNYQTPQPMSTNPTPKKTSTVILTIFLVLVTLGACALGYFWKKEVDDHSSTIKQLTSQTEIINENAQVIRDAELEPNFRKVLQDASNRECASGSAVLFNTTTSLEKNDDGTTKKYYAVGQYFCNIGAQAQAEPIRFSAAQSADGITWEFTYGSSTAQPTSLPTYIFDTDSALFNRKYNNPSTF